MDGELRRLDVEEERLCFFLHLALAFRFCELKRNPCYANSEMK